MCVSVCVTQKERMFIAVVFSHIRTYILYDFFKVKVYVIFSMKESFLLLIEMSLLCENMKNNDEKEEKCWQNEGKEHNIPYPHFLRPWPYENTRFAPEVKQGILAVLFDAVPIVRFRCHLVRYTAGCKTRPM